MRSIEEGSGPRHSPAQYRPPQRSTRLNPEPATSPEYRPQQSEHQSHWVRNERLDTRRLDRPLRYRSSNLTGTRDHPGASVPYISDSRRHLSSEPGLDGLGDETETENGVEEEWVSRFAIDAEESARAIERPRQSEHEQEGNIAAIVILQTPNFQTRTQTQDQNQDQEQNQSHGGETARPPLAATWYQFPTGQSLTASPVTSAESESGWGFWDELHQLEQRVSDGLPEALDQQPLPSWFINEAQVQCPVCGHQIQYQPPAEQSYLWDF
ncbi:uncharacterized protein BDW70DRAFT_161074 [Aspergillus foveolatus]|uniref:uncharacterized protein n=1 Tax=Aspergillus foveolatus TaxID=210207 RepID=UPI003CCD19BD